MKLTEWTVTDAWQNMKKASMFWGKGCSTTELHVVAWFPELQQCIYIDQDQNGTIGI